MVGRVGLFLHAITVLLGVVGAISANYGITEPLR